MEVSPAALPNLKLAGEQGGTGGRRRDLGIWGGGEIGERGVGTGCVVGHGGVQGSVPPEIPLRKKIIPHASVLAYGAVGPTTVNGWHGSPTEDNGQDKACAR
jgi:hypothetical protein